MAKFREDNLDLETGEKIDFNDADTISMGYDGAELYLNSTLSGVRAVQPYHMVRYDQLLQASGTLDDKFVWRDGTKELTGHWDTGYDYGIEVPYVQFNLAPSGIVHAEGKLHWNPDDGTLEVGMPGGEVILQIGQEQLVRVTNKTGSLIPNGSPVYIDGSQGGRPTVALAAANSFTTTRVIGFTTEDIADNNSGYVTTKGLVRDIDTSGITPGSMIYLSPTVSGTFQDTRPTAPDFKICLGYVITENDTTGVVLVDVIITPKLMRLSDVLEETPQHGEYLVWDGDTNRFELTSVSGGGIDHGSLLGLEDDDHIYYVPTDGSRGFTSTVSGVAAYEPYHLVIYEQLTSASGYLQNQIDDLYMAASGVETFLDLTDTPDSYTGYANQYVRVNETEDGLVFAPAILSSGTEPPASGTGGIWYNNTNQIIYYWDEVRNKWLSVYTHNYLFTYSGNIDGLYMSVGNVVNSYAHFHIIRDATITSVTADQDPILSAQPDKGYQIQANGTPIYSFNMVNNEYTNTGLNVDINTDDELQMYVVSAGARVRDPIVNLELRWRYNL